jgi:hypothetical protein
MRATESSCRKHAAAALHVTTLPPIDFQRRRIFPFRFSIRFQSGAEDLGSFWVYIKEGGNVVTVSPYPRSLCTTFLASIS